MARSHLHENISKIQGVDISKKSAYAPNTYVQSRTAVLGLLRAESLYPWGLPRHMGYPADLHFNLDPHDDFNGLWVQIVSAYSWRDLTNPEDRLFALANTVERMQTPTLGKYLVGLWMNRLPAQLLWSSASPRICRPDVTRALTWSWAWHDFSVFWPTGTLSSERWSES